MTPKEFIALSDEEKQNLTSLDLRWGVFLPVPMPGSGMWVNQQELQTLGRELSKCKKLKHLGLRDNVIQPDPDSRISLDPTPFFEAISECENLESISFNSSTHFFSFLQPKYSPVTCADSLIDIFYQCKKLKTIDLSYCGINSQRDEVSFIRLCNAIAHCKSLETLNLGLNNISPLNDTTRKALLDAFSKCETLYEVRNAITHDEPNFDEMNKEIEHIMTLHKTHFKDLPKASWDEGKMNEPRSLTHLAALKVMTSNLSTNRLPEEELKKPIEKAKDKHKKPHGGKK